MTFSDSGCIKVTHVTFVCGCESMSSAAWGGGSFFDLLRCFTPHQINFAGNVNTSHFSPRKCAARTWPAIPSGSSSSRTCQTARSCRCSCLSARGRVTLSPPKSVLLLVGIAQSHSSRREVSVVEMFLNVSAVTFWIDARSVVCIV